MAVDTATSELAKRIAGYLDCAELEKDDSLTESEKEAIIAEHIAPLEAELKLWKPMTPEQAEAAYEAAEAVPISPEEIDRIVSQVTDPTYQPTEPEHVLLAAKIRQLEKRSIRCCFCDHQCESFRDLKDAQ